MVNSAGHALQQAERVTHFKALRESEWIIGGPVGAAAEAWDEANGFQSNVQKLGIFAICN